MDFFQIFLGFFQVSSFFLIFWVSFGFWVSFRFLFWVLGAPAGEKRNPHPNPVLRESGSGSGHGCKNAPEPAPVRCKCKTRELPETRTRTAIPSQQHFTEQAAHKSSLQAWQLVAPPLLAPHPHSQPRATFSSPPPSLPLQRDPIAGHGAPTPAMAVPFMESSNQAQFTSWDDQNGCTQLSSCYPRPQFYPKLTLISEFRFSIKLRFYL
jgi:hypothetical protein